MNLEPEYSIENHPALNTPEIIGNMFEDIQLGKAREIIKELERTDIKIYKNNWLEHLFKSWAERIRKYYVLCYPDIDEHRGNTPVDFSLVGLKNKIVECKYVAVGKKFCFNRVTRQQYNQLDWENKIDNLVSYVLVGFGNKESNVCFMIPWNIYKKNYKLHPTKTYMVDTFSKKFKHFEFDINHVVAYQKFSASYVNWNCSKK